MMAAATPLLQSIDLMNSIDAVYWAHGLKAQGPALSRGGGRPAALRTGGGPLFRQPADALRTAEEAGGQPWRAADRAGSQQRLPDRGGRGDPRARAPHPRGERRDGDSREPPARSARRAAAGGAAADHRPLPAAARGTRYAQGAAAPGAAPVRVPDRRDARPGARGRDRRRRPGAAGGGGWPRVARAVP